MDIPYTLIRAKRRSISLQIWEDASLVVRAPLRTRLSFIESFIEQKQDWIKKNQIKIKQKEKKKEYSDDEIREMKKKLMAYIAPRLEKIWQENILPKYTSIKITKSETRWWSCSGKNALCFSYRLAEYLPSFLSSRRDLFQNEIWRKDNQNLLIEWKSDFSQARNDKTVFIDAIIVHELAHLKEKNHQKPFWNLVYNMMGNYEDAIKLWDRSISHLQ